SVERRLFLTRLHEPITAQGVDILDAHIAALFGARRGSPFIGVGGPTGSGIGNGPTGNSAGRRATSGPSRSSSVGGPSRSSSSGRRTTGRATDPALGISLCRGHL